ncbi:MAG: dTDP-glucose 4,6-dehydratase [Ignavibacteriae bacterium]|nr:dTDP-glucose 4,6-dehydratase [Ignavibacteriota bacterium]MCB9217316.1 dTDP-glucose 4,6-dehydratase [Ignavibacteria bacterium]
MRILVTGGCGFIGSNLIHYLLRTHEHLHLLNIDALTYAANPRNLEGVEGDPRYQFKQIDIADRSALRATLHEFRPEGIFHLAAETHVDNSIREPEPFIQANVIGTFNLLEEARLLWEEGEGRFLHVSTDEVFGVVEGGGSFDEDSPLRPNNPYSATKAGSDHLVRAWYQTYGLDVVTTNCSNNFGPRQHREKLIPTVITSALSGKPIPVYGEGQNIRDWLYIEDHCAALDLLFSEGKAGETYVIGTRNEWKNIDLVRMICSTLDEVEGGGLEGGYASLITFVEDRLGHDLRYAVDPSKIEREFGWKAERGFKQAIRETVIWYRDMLREAKEGAV